jgi:large subunit ribosomal protein L6
MSRIGRLPIDIPRGVEVKVDGSPSPVKGPKGELALTVPSPIEVKVEANQVLVTRPDDERASRSLHGLTRTLIANQIIGVTEGYSKGLEIVGTGLPRRAEGFRDRVRARLLAPRRRRGPAGITLTVEGNNKLTVAGIDKQAVGETAANIRKIKKPEPTRARASATRRGRASQGRKVR